MTAELRTFALIPAAGTSSRMGRPKLSLPLGQSTVLEHVIAAFTAAGVDTVLVVLAPHSAELAPLAQSAGAEVLLLDSATPDMRTTIERGLDWLSDNRNPQPHDWWLLSPADHPTLQGAIIDKLLQAHKQHPGASLIIPTCQGRRGHPALVQWKHVNGIRALPQGQGLNSYFRRHGDETLEVPGFSEDVLIDLDTPEDYARLLEKWRTVGHQ